MFNTKNHRRLSRGGTVLGSILETAQVIIVSLVIVFLVRTYLVQPFLVKGASMEPTFQDGNYLIIDEISYRVHPPQRGAVIVFKYPKDPQQYFIKRIIGLPNERLEIKDQKLTVFNDQNPNGMTLDETYLLSGDITKGDETIQLNSNEYFVLGDNRPASSDSRYWGPVASDLIVGKVWLRAWPLNEVSVY